MRSLKQHIQFLRAISVLLVFFYHLKLEIFSFGFLGVDIFFVISGYVITSRLYEELENKNRIDFISFYVRRIKRIFPVLVFILSIVLIFIIFFQPLDLLSGNITVYLFTIFGLSNLYYLFSKKDYFDNVFEDVFGHTWSLGVEEQFYILFPLFLFLLYKLITRKTNQVLTIFILIIFGAFLTFQYSENLQLIFYSPIFRFWEFLLGSLAYFLNNQFNNKRTNLISIISFIILIFLIIIKSYSNNFIAVLFSSIFASLFLIFYQDGGKFKFLFNNKLLVLIGNISYSFYLWHLPVIYFYDLYFVDSFIKIPFIFLLTFALSFITYNYIENKFRNKKLIQKKNIKTSIISLLIFFLLILSVVYIFQQKSYENRFKKIFKDLIYKINFLENKFDYSQRVIFYRFNLNNNEIYRFCTKQSKYFKLNEYNLRQECLIEGLTKKRLFFIEGNSHTANYIPLFNKVKNNLGDSIYYEHSTKILNPNTIDKIHNLKKFYNEIVFVTNIENYNLNNLDLIKDNLDKNINVLLLSTVPNLNQNIEPLKCLIKKIDCKYSKRVDYDSRNLNYYFDKIDEFITINKDRKFLFFNSYKTLCSTEYCFVYNFNKDILTHRDKSHLTIEGSISLENDFLNFYNKNY